MTTAAIMHVPEPETGMADPILTDAEWANWRTARAAGDTEALVTMLTLLARGGRWAAIAALALDGRSMLRVGWELHRVARDRYEVRAPGGITGMPIVVGTGRTAAEAMANAETYEQRMDALLPKHLR